MSLLGEDTFASESARKTDRWACAAAVVAIRLDSFSLPNLAQRMSADAVSGLQFFKHTVLRERRKTDVQELGRNFLLSSADIEHDPTKTQLLAAHLASIEKFYQLVLKNPKWDGSLLGKRIIGDGQVLNFLNTFAKAQHEVLDRLSSVLNVQAYQVASFNAE